LIELLTVIAIIAILMGLLLPALNAAKNAARKSQAKNDITNMVTAVKAFYSEYGFYPIAPGGAAADQEYGGANDQTGNQDVVNILRADANSADTLSSGTATTPISVNTREVVYLDVPLVKDNKNPKSGLSSTSTTASTIGANKGAGVWYDPWGTPYIVTIDGNYDGYVGPLATAVLLNYSDVNYVQFNGGNAVQGGVIAGSFGADRVQGSATNSKVFQGSDDILSWQ